MTSSPPRTARFRIGTRELVIAFAIVEAVVLCWLVLHVPRRGHGAPSTTTDSATLLPRAQ